MVLRPRLYLKAGFFIPGFTHEAGIFFIHLQSIISPKNMRISKSETRNPKQIRNPKNTNDMVSNIRIFIFRYCFEFRYSIFVFYLMVLMNLTASAQSTVKLTGRVIDADSRKPLLGAEVVILHTGCGAATDARGEFEIEDVLAGEYIVRISHIGYEAQRFPDVVVFKDCPTVLHAALRLSPVTLETIRVTADRAGSGGSNDRLVIGRETIQSSNALSIGELIRQVPGIDVQESGGPGEPVTVSIRGSQTNQVLVLLDGVPLNDERTGDVDLSAIPLAMVESVEIEKGAGSHRWGSGAVGGVIQISTRPLFQPRVSLDTGGGAFDT